MAKCSNGTVIPTDNTPLPCEEFTSTDCIIYETAIAYLGLPADTPLTQVLQAMMLSLIDVRNRVITLENA